MRKYDLVIFDVDGTLLDTSEGIMEAVCYTVQQKKLVEPNQEALRSFIGPPIMNSLKHFYGLDEEMALELTKVFRERYKNNDVLKAKPYDGIYSLFEMLKVLNVKTAIATYKRQDYAEKIIKHFRFNEYTTVIFGADDENKLVKKDIIECCVRRAGVLQRERVLMVGDSDNDAIGALSLGIDFLGVTYGFGFLTKEEIYKYGAVYAADTVDEIKMFIKESTRNES